MPTAAGVKLHLHFDAIKGVPADATLTPAARSETAELARSLRPGRLYVVDRGYADYELFATIIRARSSLIAWVKGNTRLRRPGRNGPLRRRPGGRGGPNDVVLSSLGMSHHKDHLSARCGR